MTSRINQVSGLAEPSTGELVKWLTSITKPVHRPLLISTLFRFVNLSLEIILFAIAGWLVTKYAQGEATLSGLWWLGGVAIAKAISFYFEQFLGHFVAFKALELLRGHAFAKLWPKAPAIIANSRSGEVLTSLTRDVDRIEVVYAHTFAPVVSAVVVPIGFIIGVGFSINWAIVAVPALAFIISMTLVPWLGAKESFGSTNRALSLRRELNAHITDSVFGVEEVVGYARQDERLAQTWQLAVKTGEAAQLADIYRGLRRGINIFLILVSCIAVVLIGLESNLSSALVAGLAAGVLRFFEGPRGVEEAVGALDASLAAARRIWHLSNRPEKVHDGLVDLDEIPGKLAVNWENVSYSYPNRPGLRPALDDISLKAEAAKHTVLMGRSGSGKSTTVKLLLRYDDADNGIVKINDQDIRQFTLDSLRRNVVLVQQNSEILDATIADNLRLGAPQASDEQLWDALEIACLADEIKTMPNQLATPTGQDGAKLSGGQGQRLCLARALLVNPRILVLDEFTANLNSSLAMAIRENLRSKLPELTIIEVTHRVDEITDSWRNYHFDAGRLLQDV